MKIPLMRPKLPKADRLRAYLHAIDENRTYTNFGPLNARLQDRVAEWYSQHHRASVNVVTTSSATSALELLIQSLNLSPGATILVPALTFVATGSVVLRMGFKAVACDVDRKSWLMTPNSVEGVDLSRVEAAIPVATFGVPQDVKAWSAWSQRTGVRVIIDAAAAFGGQLSGDNVPVVFSLHATKPLGSAEGGLILTSNSDQAELIKRLSNFGLPAVTTSVGTNAKLSEYHAAIALAALEDWGETVVVRRALYDRYVDLIKQKVGAEFIHDSLSASYCPPVFLIKFEGSNARARCESLCAAQGVETRRWYTPLLTEHPALAGGILRGTDLANASIAASSLLGLPFYNDLSFVDVERVVNLVAAASR